MDLARESLSSQHSTINLVDIFVKDIKLVKMIKPFDGYI